MVRVRRIKNRRIAHQFARNPCPFRETKGARTSGASERGMPGDVVGLTTSQPPITAHHSNQRNQRFKLLRASNRRLTSGAIGRVANNTVTLAATQNPAKT